MANPERSALQLLNDELRRTNVISKEFKSDIISLAQSIAMEAYEQGREVGRKETWGKSQ